MRNLEIFRKVDSFTESKQAKQAGLYPYFRQSISGQGSTSILKGDREVLMLGSNSYLDLNGHPKVKEAAIEAIRKYGAGCTGSRLLNGTLDIHEELEHELADWTGKEAALLYPTGFQVNQGVIGALLTRKEHIILDYSNHASIIDGARVSMAKIHRYAHNDIEKLATVLRNIPRDAGKLIVSDGIFSMEGDIAKLPEITKLAGEYNGAIMLDDAHAIGVLGQDGGGTASHFGLTAEVDFIMGTFSKSLGSQGGFVAADNSSIEFLKHHSRSFIFSASTSPASVASTLAALKIIRAEPERIAKLWRNSKMMREGLQSLGLNTGLSETPIISVYIGDVMTLVLLCKRLEEDGIFVNPILPPAVAPNACLIRISIMSSHSDSQLSFALDTIEKACKDLDVI